uniref:Uncharacterized protein n=1 Tax=Oryza glumipatula TaxID=40148 RepID=A0A0E0AY51_9ORYZ
MLARFININMNVENARMTYIVKRGIRVASKAASADNAVPIWLLDNYHGGEEDGISGGRPGIRDARPAGGQLGWNGETTTTTITEIPQSPGKSSMRCLATNTQKATTGATMRNIV